MPGMLSRSVIQTVICQCSVATPYALVLVVENLEASAHQFPLPAAGSTEISAALVQPLFQMARKEVKRKYLASTGAKLTS